MKVLPKRLLRMTFSLRAMLIVTAIVAVLGGRWLISARNQRDTLERLRDLCSADELVLEVETDGGGKWFDYASTEKAKEIYHFLDNISTVRISSNGENGWHLSNETVECLTRFSSLKKLRLSEVRISRQALTYIEQTNLEELDLWSVSIAEQLDRSRAIGLPRSLRKLNVSDWQTDLSFFLSLGQLSQLREIDIRNVDLTDDHMVMICSLEKLESVKLDGSMPISADSLAEIGNLKHLSTLEILSRDASIDNSVLDALATLPDLKTLTIPTRGIQGKQLSQLANCKSLHSLQLVGCPENEADLSGLCEIKSLQNVEFQNWGKPVSETIFGYLLKLNRLETISAGRAGVSIRSAKQMLDLPSFASINHATNKYTFDRMYFLTGDPRGSMNSWSIDFSNQVDVSGELGFLKTAKRVSGVHLLETDITDSDMNDIAQTPELGWLRIQGTSVTDAGVAHLGNATHLTRLNLYDIPLTCEVFPLIENLEGLSIDGSRITAAGWRAIGRLPKLRELRVQAATVNADVISEIGKIASLQELRLIGCAIESNALEPIGSHSGLTRLFLIGSRFQKREPIGLDSLTQLRELKISNTQIGSVQIEALAGLQKLEQIDLRETDVGDSSVDVLASLPVIKLIQLYDTEVTDEGKRRLQSKVAKNTRINGTNTPTITDKTLAAHLRANHHLWINATNSFVTDAGLGLLANYKDIRFIILADTKVGDEGMKTIGKLDSLYKLDVHGTLVTDAGIRALEPLSESLKVLNLSHTLVTPAVVDSLAQLRLEDLNLDNTAVKLRHVVNQMPEHELDHLVTSDCDLHVDEIRYVFTNDKRYTSSSLRLYGPWWNWERVGPMIGNRYVQEVAIQSTTLNDKSVELLVSFPFLRLINWIDELPSDVAFSRLAQCRFLQKMRFQGVQVTQALIDNIAAMPHLRDIEFDDVQGLDSIDLGPLVKSNFLQVVTIRSRKENLHLQRRLKKQFQCQAKLVFSETKDRSPGYSTDW